MWLQSLFVFIQVRDKMYGQAQLHALRVIQKKFVKND